MRTGGRWIRHRAAPFDENAARPDRLGVDLRSECASDRAHVSAGLQPFATEDGLARVRAACDYVGAPHGILERCDGMRAGIASGQVSRTVSIPRGDPDLFEIADARKRLDMRPALRPRAKDREHGRVVASEDASRDRSRAAGADGRDVSAIQQRNRRAGGLVEQRDQTLVRRQAMLIVGRKHRDQLRLERDTRNVTGHQSEQSTVAQPHGCARRHRSRSGGVDDECVGERFEHRVDIQKALHIRAAEVQQLAHRRDHIHLVAQFLRNGKLLTLMLGHFAVDSYVGVIPVLYPVLIGRFHLSLATVGTVGVAAGPLIGILVFGAFGLHGTGLLVIPGVVTGGYLLWRMRGLPSTAPAQRRTGLPVPSVPVFALAIVIAVMMSRSWTVNVFQAFTPTWYRQLGYGPEFYGPLATTLVLASAVGTVGCGSLADRYGRRSVILVTLVLSIPAILLYTMFPGPWAFGSAILIGVLAASTAPLMLLMAQQLMASRAGLASGLVMGLGFVTGAVGIPINGAIADAVGLQKSLLTQVVLVRATIVIAWFLPTETEMERYSEVVPSATPAIAN